MSNSAAGVSAELDNPQTVYPVAILNTRQSNGPERLKGPPLASNGSAKIDAVEAKIPR